MKIAVLACAAVLCAVPAAFPADTALLNLVMPDAKVVAGLHVQQAKNSPFGQYVLGRIQSTDSDFQKFITATGFDPRQDLTDIVTASTVSGGLAAGGWLVVASGTFDVTQIVSAARSNGATTSTYRGLQLISFASSAPTSSSPALPTAGQQPTVAFLDNATAVMGELPAVQDAIGRRLSGATAPSDLISKVQQASVNNDFWFATLVPVSSLMGALPAASAGMMNQQNLLQSITAASGGVRFGSNVLFTAEATTRSDKDATALGDVIRFIAGVMQSQPKNPTATQAATLLDALDLKTAGNVLTISLTLPEQQLEQLLESGHHNGTHAHRREAKTE